MERQSEQLLGYLDALFRRLVLPRQADEEPTYDCSREEIRALILLRTRGGVTMTDMAAELGVPLSTATHTVDRLVRKGLVVRVRSEKDRRIVQVELSDDGRAFQAALRAKHQAMARSWLTPLSAGERDIFLELMAKITERAQPESVMLNGAGAGSRRVSPGGNND